MIIDTKIIQKLLDDTSVTAYDIEKETGISRSSIGKYRNKKQDIMSMRLDIAAKLIEYYKKIEE